MLVTQVAAICQLINQPFSSPINHLLQSSMQKSKHLMAAASQM